MKPSVARFLVLTPMLWSLGCTSEESTHPPFCTDCIPTGATTIGTSSGGADSTGGTTNAAGTATTVNTTGQIVDVEDSTFRIETGTISTNTFLVQAPTSGGVVFESTVTSAFTLDGVLASRAAWLTAKPATNSDLMRGVVGFDSTTQSNVVIPLVRQSNLELVANSLMSMTTIDNAKAQVVLRIIDAAGLAVSGVKATVTAAENVAYDSLAGYSDDAAGTGSSGLAFLFNIPASSVPLATVLTLSGTATAHYSVFVLAGAATIGEVVVARN